MQDRGPGQPNSRCRTATRGLRALPPVISFVLVLLALFTPDAANLLPLLNSRDATCGMACCKRSGVCCCRKARSARTGAESGWRAGNPCGPDCARSAAVRSQFAFALTAPAAAFLCSTSQHAGSLEPGGAYVPGGVAFERFGRPPPLA